MHRVCTMRSKISRACGNTGEGATFSETKPGAGFQAGQVRGRFPPHTAPQRPPWPLLLRGPRSHIWPASSGPESHRPRRQCFPTARAQVWREAPAGCIQGLGGEAGHLEADGLSQVQSLHAVAGHSWPQRPGWKVKGGDEVTGSRPLQGALQRGPGWSKGECVFV